MLLRKPAAIYHLVNRAASSQANTRRNKRLQYPISISRRLYEQAPMAINQTLRNESEGLKPPRTTLVIKLRQGSGAHLQPLPASQWSCYKASLGFH